MEASFFRGRNPWIAPSIPDSSLRICHRSREMLSNVRSPPSPKARSRFRLPAASIFVPVSICVTSCHFICCFCFICHCLFVCFCHLEKIGENSPEFRNEFIWWDHPIMESKENQHFFRDNYFPNGALLPAVLKHKRQITPIICLNNHDFNFYPELSLVINTLCCYAIFTPTTTNLPSAPWERSQVESVTSSSP